MATTRGHRSERGHDRRLWLAALGLALMLAGLGLGWIRGQVDGATARSSSGMGPELPAFVVAPSPRLREAPPTPAPAAGAPRRLLVPAIGVDAPVVPVEVRDGTLFPPDDARVLGWWSDGAPAGAVAGGTLITGHTVHTGGGALDDLEVLEAGDTMHVRTRGGSLEYVVAVVATYRKASLARVAERVFSQSVPHRLVLVTCEDWDGSRYLSNVVVVAEPAM